MILDREAELMHSYRKSTGVYQVILLNLAKIPCEFLWRGWKKQALDNEEDVKAITQRLTNDQYEVTSITKKERKRNPKQNRLLQVAYNKKPLVS